MRYQVLEPFRVRTSQGETELQIGQIITLPQDKALWLIEKGKITPIGRVAYKVYSEILQAYLWVVYADEDIKTLRDQGITEPIYTGEEIDRLNGKSKEELKVVRKVKKVFPEGKVEDERE